MKRSSRSSSNPEQAIKSWSPNVRAFLVHLQGLPEPLDKKTMGFYRSDLEDAEDFLGKRGKNLANPSADDLNAYLEQQAQTGHSPDTVARRYAALRKYLKFLF